MVRLRLWGTPEEISELAKYLKELPRLRVLYSSSNCPDRGESKYNRIYIDVELLPAKGGAE